MLVILPTHVCVTRLQCVHRTEDALMHYMPYFVYDTMPWERFVSSSPGKGFIYFQNRESDLQESLWLDPFISALSECGSPHSCPKSPPHHPGNLRHHFLWWTICWCRCRNLKNKSSRPRVIGTASSLMSLTATVVALSDERNSMKTVSDSRREIILSVFSMDRWTRYQPAIFRTRYICNIFFSLGETLLSHK